MELCFSMLAIILLALYIHRSRLADLWLCRLRAVRLVFFVLAACALTFAQDKIPTDLTDQNRTGELPFSVSIGTSVEHLDVVSGTPSVRIPIVSVPGRGMNFDFSLRWEGAFWTVSGPSIGTNTLGKWNIEFRPYIPMTSTQVPSNGLGWQTSIPYVTNTYD